MANGNPRTINRTYDLESPEDVDNSRITLETIRALERLEYWDVQYRQHAEKAHQNQNWPSFIETDLIRVHRTHRYKNNIKPELNPRHCNKEFDK